MIWRTTRSIIYCRCSRLFKCCNPLKILCNLTELRLNRRLLYLNLFDCKDYGTIDTPGRERDAANMAAERVCHQGCG